MVRLGLEKLYDNTLSLFRRYSHDEPEILLHLSKRYVYHREDKFEIML